MNREKNILRLSMINNAFLATIKIGSGILGKNSSLISDGIHTFSDFVTDIVALIGANLSKKKPNKIHPFGYGQIEYVIIFCLGMFLLVESFLGTPQTPEPWIFGMIFFCFLLKMGACLILSKEGKKLKSNVLIASSKESFADVASSVLVFLANILMLFSNQVQIFRYANQVGSIIIAFLVLQMAFQVLKENIIALIGENEEDEELQKEIEKELETIPLVDVKQVTLVKYGTYYQAEIKVRIDENIKIHRLLKLEKRMTKKMRKKKFRIRYVTIEVVE